MSGAILLSFLEYLVIYSYTPGPANFFSLKVGSQYGYKHFLKVYPGLFCGCLFIMLTCNILMNSFERVMPSMINVFHYLGNAYILWVAWHIFRSKPTNIEEVEKLKGKPTFITGFVLNVSNMKILMFGMTLMQMYVMPYFDTLIEQLLVTVGISFLISTSTLFWGYCGKMFSNFLSKHHKVCNTTMAALLVWCIF